MIVSALLVGLAFGAGATVLALDVLHRRALRRIPLPARRLAEGRPNTESRGA